MGVCVYKQDVVVYGKCGPVARRKFVIDRDIPIFHLPEAEEWWHKALDAPPSLIGSFSTRHGDCRHGTGISTPGAAWAFIAASRMAATSIVSSSGTSETPVA